MVKPGKSRRAAGGYACGCRFTAIDPAARASIAEYVGTSREIVTFQLNRLRRLYVERTPTTEDGGEALSFEMLQRLCHYVTSEGYGE